MPVIKEFITRENLRFLLRPRVALALIRGRVPNIGEFAMAMERAKEEIDAGFCLEPGHIESTHQLTGASHEVICAYLEDLRSNDRFYAHLRSNIMQYGCYAGIKIDTFAPVYYVMVRVIQPRIAVETGVANGISSCFILQAMEDNGEGRLYSIDVPAFITKPGGESGWLIPDWLRDRWDLTLGRSAEKLVPLLKRIGPIDLFISDSAHYYENEMFEFTAAWPFLANGGVLGCDDVTHCVALQDFSQGVGLNMVRFDGPRYAMGFINKDA